MRILVSDVAAMARTTPGSGSKQALQGDGASALD
jgi:hypothetical protein